MFPTEPFCEPLRLVVVLDGDGAGVEEDQHDHEPEPGGRLREREQGHDEEEEDDQGVWGNESRVKIRGNNVVDHVDVEDEYGHYIAIKNMSSGKTTTTLLERRIEQRNI